MSRFSLSSETPSLGRFVNYVMADSDYAEGGANRSGKPAGAQATPRIRPAQIVETWGAEKESDATKWHVNLVVTVDGMNDGYPSNTLWKTSVPHSEDPKAQGTWHWPER